MTTPLLSPTFLFRFAVPCRHLESPWSTTQIELPPEYRIPSFSEMDGARMFADVRLGWSHQGLGVSVRVRGKRQAPWCRDTRIEDSDGLSLWIDTRDTHNIHRATRFCHWFALRPQGAGRLSDQPIACLLPIPRARENPRPVAAGRIEIRSEKRVDGYVLRALIPADAITGYDPDEHLRLGFTYAVTDRELGWQTFSINADYPFDSDPSLWGTLELARNDERADEA